MACNDAQKETIEMVAISSVVPLIPNINVGENERWSFHTLSYYKWFCALSGLAYDDIR